MYQIVIVAFSVQAADDKTAQEQLMPHLPRPEVDLPGYPAVDCWWIAQDERYDRSDNDSAVFVKMGKEAEARDLLVRVGLAH